MEIGAFQSVIVAVAGYVLSILLEAIPWLKEHWSDWPYKAMSLLGLFIIIGVGWWALQCWTALPLPALDAPCGWEGAVTMAVYAAIAWAGSQSGFATAARYMPNAQERIEDVTG